MSINDGYIQTRSDVANINGKKVAAAVKDINGNTVYINLHIIEDPVNHVQSRVLSDAPAPNEPGIHARAVDDTTHNLLRQIIERLDTLIQLSTPPSEV